MATFKATSNNNSNGSGVFKATKRKSYDSSYVNRLEDEAKESSKLLSDYTTRRKNNEWMSEDDISNYRSALDRYKSSVGSLRGLGNYSEEDDKAWSEYVSSLTTDLDTQGELSSNFKTRNDYFGYLMTNVDDETNGDSAQERLGYYDTLSSRVAEIEKELDNWEYERGYAWTTNDNGLPMPTLTSTPKDKSKYDGLVAEKERLQTYLRQYERRGKHKDATFAQYASNQDYESTSTNREFGNSTKDEYDEFDTKAYGGHISYYDGSPSTNVDPLFDYSVSPEDAMKHMGVELSINDPLGFYLDTVDGYAEEGEPSFYSPNERIAGAEHNSVLLRGDNAHWSNLKDDEIQMYYYLLNSQGKESAMSFLDGLEAELDYRETEEYKEYLANAPTMEVIFANAMSIPASIAGGAIAFADDAINMLQGEDPEPYNSAHALKNFAEGTRGVTAQKLNDLTDNGEFLGLTLGDTYQAVMSFIDSYAGAKTFGKGYMGLMVTGAASSGVKELYESGASKEQIVFGAAINGAAEYLGEKIPLDNFLKIKGSTKSIGQLIGRTFLQGGYEMGGEMITEITNIVGEAINLRSESEWAKLLEENDGAFWDTVKELATERVWKAGASGFISGFGMGGVATTADYAQNQPVIKAEGKSIIESGGVDDLKALALDVAGKQSGISNFATKVALKSQAGKVSNEMNGRNAKRVGTLSTQVNEIRHRDNIADITTALVEKGLSKGEAKQAAEYLYYDTDFDKIDSKAMRRVMESDAVKAVRKELASPDSVTSKRNLQYGLARMGLKQTEDGDITMTEQKAQAVQRAMDAAAGGFSTDAETELPISADGKAVVTKTGEEVKTLAFAEGEGGKLRVRVNGKTTVDVGDVSYADEGQAYVVSAIADLGLDATVAQAAFEAYTGHNAQHGARYAENLKVAYKYGRYSLGKSSLGNVLYVSPALANRLYESGQKQSRAEFEKAQAAIDAKKKTGSKPVKGEVIFEGELAGEDGKLAIDEGELTDIQRASLRGVEMLAEVSSLRFHIFRSTKTDGTYKWVMENGEETSANGMYIVGTNDIYIDLNAGNNGEGTMLFTAAHEISHFIKEYSAQRWKAIADFIMAEYAKGGKNVDALFAEKIAKVRERADAADMTEQQVEDLAYEELVSDALSRMLIDGTVVEMTANLRKADKGLWNVFKKAVSALLEKWSAVFEAYKNKTPDAKEAQWLDGAESSFKKLQKMFAEAFADASDAYERVGKVEDGSSERNKKAQARELQRKDPTQLKEADLVNLLGYAKDKLLDDDTYIPVRIGTPQILIAFARELGYQLDNHPLAMRVYKARQALSNEADWDGDYKDKPHNLSPENIVEIIFALNDPSYLVFQTENERFAEIIKFQREGSKEKAYAIVDFSDVDKNPAVMNGYKGGKYNILVTVYPSENAAELKTYLSKKNHKVVTGEAMKKKGASQGSYGGNTPSLLNDTPFFNDSIPNPAEKVKVKNSDRDYSYNALTSKPDMVVTTLGGTVPGNRADVVAAAKKNAAKIGKANKDGSVSVHVKDIGRDVVLPTSGLRHGLDRRFNINAPVTVKAGEILQHSICINELTPTKEAASASYVLVGTGANEDGELYVVRSVINRFTSELTEIDVLYAINAKTEPVGEKKRNQAGADPQGLRSNDRFLTGSTESAAFPPKVTTKVATPTDSTISIAKLLDYVNRYFPDILPEDVLSHFGHTERPAGKLGKNVLYQQRSTDRDDTKAERKGRFNRHAVETALWDALDHGDAGHDNLILVSEMPQYIVDKFGIEGDFYIYRDHAYENMVSKDQAIDEGRPVTHHGQKAHFHGLGIDKMTKAILSINDPTMVIATKSKDGNPSVIMLLDEFGSNGAPLYAVLSFYSNKAVNGDWSRKPHIVLTIAERNYTETGGRAGYDEIIRNAIKDGRVLDYNIRKRDDLSVIANSAGVGNITKSSLEDSLTRFRKEIKTFREKNKINYQQRNTDSDHDEVVKQLEQENKKLAADLAEVKELLSLQGKVTGGKVFTKSSVQLVAKRLMREASAEGNAAELAALLEEVYHYIADGGEVTWDGVTDKAAPALAWLESHEGKRQVLSEEAKEILRDIRSKTVYLDDVQKQEADYAYGSYNDFRKKAFGRITVSDNAAVSLDEQWQEWAQMYPGKFRADTNSADMVTELMAVIDDLQHTYDYSGSSLMDRQGLLLDIYDGFWDVATLHTAADKAQREITLLKGKHKRQMSDLRVKHREADDKLRQEYAGKMARVRQDAKTRREKSEKKIAQRYQEQRKKSVERHRKTETRHRIEKIVKDLDRLLNRGTKESNVKAGLQETVGSALSFADVLFKDDITNEDIVLMGVDAATDAERTLLEQYERMMKARDAATSFKEASGFMNHIAKLDKKLADLFVRERARLNRAKVSDAIDALTKAYAKLESTTEDYINFAYNSDMHKRLTDLSEDLEGVVVRDMSLAQLEEVYTVFKAVRHIVSTANQLFRMGKTQDLAQMVATVQAEIRENDKDGKRDPSAGRKKMLDFFLSFGWNNMKPLTAFEALGSSAYEELFWDVIEAEGVWAKDMEEARQFLDEQRKKFGYKAWKMDETKTFLLPDGKEFRLTLQDRLSIYAYSKRDQAEKHMTEGGFQFHKNSTYKDGKGRKMAHLSDLFVVDADTIQQVIDSLTEEQKEYADAVQGYLTKMGQKGNEVSRVLYGIDIFTETAYFPLMSSKDYLSSVRAALDGTQTQASLKNTGMTKPTKPDANNPIILQAFDDVVYGHIDKMAKYHAFVLPIENLRRVFDGSTTKDGKNYVSTKAVINEVFGESAQKYFKQYITDLNGGTFADGAESPTTKLVSRFKGTAVGAKLSVIAQQPMAIIRAMDLIDPKYVVGKVDKGEERTNFEEAKKYAPVAIVKEMGGFDTGSSRTGREYLGLRTDKGLERVVDEVSDKAMWGAEQADKLGWGILWMMVKREVAAEQKLTPGSEEFFKSCGKRFTEVVVRTQVYDSVNSRSAYMRSKNWAVRYAVSFMGEPTTVVNMACSSALKVMRAKTRAEKIKAGRHMGRTIGVLVVSTVLTAVAKSFVYAMDDDGDDEAFFERWAKHTGDNLGLFGDLNPLTMLPFARDIVSAWEGWNIERPDMTLIANLITSAKRVMDGDTDTDEVLTFVGDAANLFGIPAKNVIKDAKGIVNVFDDIFDGIAPTDVGGAFLRGLTGEERSNTEALYAAIVSGDEGKQEVIRSRYKTEATYEAAIKRALRENDPRIREALKLRVNEGVTDAYHRLRQEIVNEGRFTQSIVNAALKAEYNYFIGKIEEAADLLKDGEKEASDEIIKDLKKEYKGTFTQDDILKAVKKRAGLLK